MLVSPSVPSGVIFDAPPDPLPDEAELGGVEWNNRERDRVPLLLALPRAAQPSKVLSGEAHGMCVS